MLILALIALVLNACGVAQEQPQSEVNIKASSETAVGTNKKLYPKGTDLESIVSTNRPKQKIIYPPITHLNGMNRKEVIDL
jgi:hypothetical protein